MSETGSGGNKGSGSAGATVFLETPQEMQNSNGSKKRIGFMGMNKSKM